MVPASALGLSHHALHPKGGAGGEKGAREWQVVGLGGKLSLWGGSWAGGVASESCPVRRSLGVARWTGLGSDAGVSAPRAGGVHGGPVGPGPPASCARV